jgi:hypothetical protein
MVFLGKFSELELIGEFISMDSFIGALSNGFLTVFEKSVLRSRFFLAIIYELNSVSLFEVLNILLSVFSIIVPFLTKLLLVFDKLRVFIEKVD